MASSVSHKSTNVVEPRFTSRNHAPGHTKSHKSFGTFEIHHLKIPYYLNKDLDC